MYGDYPIKLRWIWLTVFFSWALIILGVALGLDPEYAAVLFYGSIGAACCYMVFCKKIRSY